MTARMYNFDGAEKSAKIPSKHNSKLNQRDLSPAAAKKSRCQLHMAVSILRTGVWEYTILYYCGLVSVLVQALIH